MTHDVIVSFDRVSYFYPRSDAPVLRDISLEVVKGEFLGLIGPTGAGKTTLCLTLNGIVPQFYGGRFFGHVTVAGLDTLDHPVSRLAQHVGAVFEDPETQLTATSVENEIAFALENLQVPREEIRARIRQVLEAVRLEGSESRHPHELSGGQKQRLAIAAALALRPDVLLLDEPTSQLDPVGAQEVFATIRELNRTLGMTIIMASHAAEALAEHADRIALLSHGTLARLDRPERVFSDVAFLREHDLRPPQVAETFHLLNHYGIEVPTLPVRLQAGIETLKTVQRPCDRAVGPSEAVPPPPTPESEPLLSVRNLHHTYSDGTQALKGLSLDIHQGEYVLIVGQNGAGKSTLIKHFLNLLEPTEGAVLIDGTETRALSVSALARRIGYVAQNPDSQIFNTSVWDEVAFALKHLRHSQAEIEARTRESLDALGLLDVRDQHPLALPRGDRARVVIAAVLAIRPEIMIFDEPTTGQDYRGARYILEISKRLHKRGQTVIVVTHHLYLMPAYAERVLVMGKGVKLLDAPIRAAFHATDLLNATYLTPPQAVLLAQSLCADGDQGACALLTPEEVAAHVACTPLDGAA